MKNIISGRLVGKLIGSLVAVLLLAGVGYTGITIYLANKFYAETTQRLNAEVAQHLIDEKFKDERPFLENGDVNKALFGDIMHDMMAVNRGIEVYLLDLQGNVEYSVVLDHDRSEEKVYSVSVEPILEFIDNPGGNFILGDDPRNPQSSNIFSAARFTKNGREGYIYIVLAGERFATAKDSLAQSYFLKLGAGGSFLTFLFAGLMGALAIWYLTKNVRQIVFAANRFKQGDLQYRIDTKGDTDLSKVAETFNEMAETILLDIEKIKSVEKLRRELIANISHDLRTPLSIMQGYVETLQMKQDEINSQQQSEYLKLIHSSSQKLSHLISQLFEYSKLEANQVEPKKEPFLIADLLGDLNARYQLQAEKLNINLSLKVENNTPVVFGDIGLVERALQNLIDNALKFTPEGGNVTVGVEKDDNSVVLSVKDSGPGIPKNEQSVIFERYRQAKTGKESSGAGLGLAIVKKIVEIHNSSVKVLSKPNEGTTFSFDLPVYQLA